MIKRAAGLADLERLEQQHGASFDHIHTAAAITQAAQLAVAGAAAASFHPLLGRLWQQRLRPQLDDCGARQLANIVWACGKLAYAEAALLDACLERLVLKAGKADAQHLANAVYAAALLRDSGYRIGERQARQLVAELVAKRGAAKPQELSNTLWAAAAMGLRLPEEQGQQLVAALVQRRQAAKPQELSNTLWAAATMGLQLPEEQAQQLVEELVLKRQGAKPQELSNTLWAAATMGLPLPASTWRLLLQQLASKAAQAAPQALSNTLWAAAKRRADFAQAEQGKSSAGTEATVLQLAEDKSSRQVTGMKPQEVSNSLWALSELGLHPPRLTALLADVALCLASAMAPQHVSNTAPQHVSNTAPQHVSNTALALAKLGCRDAQLFAALVEADSTREESFTLQAICNLCWAVAVADQRQLSGAVVKLCGQLAEQAWGTTMADDHRQLHQTHLWLLDQQPGAAACCSQEARTEDGAFSIDVAATRAASGRRLAMEADGPTHFLRLGREVTGDTLARNKALAARGYVVVSVPYWEWNQVQGDAAREAAYLQGKVEAALAASPAPALVPAAAPAPVQPQPAGLAGVLALRKRRRGPQQQHPSET